MSDAVHGLIAFTLLYGSFALAVTAGALGLSLLLEKVLNER